MESGSPKNPGPALESAEEALDPEHAAADSREQLRFYHLVQVPRVRWGGAGLLAIALFLHTWLIPGSGEVRKVITFAIISFSYALAAWGLAHLWVRRFQNYNLPMALTLVDPLYWILAILWSGGERTRGGVIAKRECRVCAGYFYLHTRGARRLAPRRG